MTADPWAGVCEDEVFDPTQYVGAYVRYFVRHPTTQLMPRKIKTAFTGAEPDRAITGIHDIAFLARERDGVKGFEVRVGGGTSIMPRVAPTLYEFVEADNGDYLKIAEAVFRIFDNQDWLRVNRARARIKVFVDKFGIDELRRQVEEELKGDWVAERDFTPDQFGSTTRRRTRPRSRRPRVEPERRPRASSSASRRSAVKPQRQAGFSTVHVHVPRGDLTPEQLRGIGQIMRDFTRRLRAHDRPPELRAALGARRGALRRLAAAAGARPRPARAPTRSPTSSRCPGTDSCKLGITSSMGLNLAIRERLAEMGIDDPLVRKMHIKMSGCPNGCSQHHIADIGFYGASIKVGENTMPAYIAHVGGEFDTGQVAYGVAPEGAPRRPSACRRPSTAGSACTRRSARRASCSASTPAASATTPFEDAGPRPGDADRVRPRHDEHVHRLEPQRALPGHPGRRRMRGLATLDDLPRRGRRAATATGS